MYLLDKNLGTALSHTADYGEAEHKQHVSTGRGRPLSPILSKSHGQILNCNTNYITCTQPQNETSICMKPCQLVTSFFPHVAVQFQGAHDKPSVAVKIMKVLDTGHVKIMNWGRSGLSTLCGTPHHSM
jgi:hypothetical protein